MIVLANVILSAVSATLVNCADCPRISIDGKPVSGTAVMPSPKVAPGDSVGTLREFADAGIALSSDVWTMYDPRYTPKQWWIDDGVYDWDLFDRLVAGLTDASPDMRIFPRIKIDPPGKWLASHPTEAFPYYVKKQQHVVRPDSRAWRGLYARMLKDMVAHVERSAYADRVVGYHLGAFECGEWLIDHSAVPFPAVEWDPRDSLPPLQVTAERRAAIDRYTDAVADAAIDAAATLRELVGRRKLIGGFFGYVWFPHEKIARALAMSEFDFYAAPPHYENTREVGQTGCSQAYFLSSFRLHGKVFYEESDYRTFLSEPVCSPKGMTRMRPLGEAVELIRRSIGNCLAGGWENWWFLLGGNQTYSAPEMMEAIRIGAVEEKRTLASAKWTPAEVAVFTSADEYATSQKTVNHAFRRECKIRPHTEILPVTGVPFDSYELSDVENPHLPEYKVYLFLNAFTLSEERRERIKTLVRRTGKTAVWVHAPGYYRVGTGSVSNVVDLTGIRLDETYPVAEGICSRRFAATDGNVVENDGARSVYFPLPPSAAELREAFRAAGAHVWLETQDVLAVGRGYVMLHAAADGAKRIRLPNASDAVEIFGENAPLTNVKEIAFDLRLGQTRVFRISDGSVK